MSSYTKEQEDEIQARSEALSVIRHNQRFKEQAEIKAGKSQDEVLNDPVNVTVRDANRVELKAIESRIKVFDEANAKHI